VNDALPLKVASIADLKFSCSL